LLNSTAQRNNGFLGGHVFSKVKVAATFLANGLKSSVNFRDKATDWSVNHTQATPESFNFATIVEDSEMPYLNKALGQDMQQKSAHELKC
jgi:hypothetical protein